MLKYLLTCMGFSSIKRSIEYTATFALISLTCLFNHFRSSIGFSTLFQKEVYSAGLRRTIATESKDRHVRRKGKQLCIRVHNNASDAKSCSPPTIVKLVRLWAVVYWFFMIPLWKQQRLTYSREHRDFKYLVLVERFRRFFPLSEFCCLFSVGRLAFLLILRITEIIIILNRFSYLFIRKFQTS